MAKYSNTSVSKTALKTTPNTTVTYEGALALEKDARTELFTLAVTYFGSENKFYESASAADTRLSHLVEHLTKEDPEFIERLVPYLRNIAQMRTVPVMIAAEYCFAGGPNRRKVVNSAMSRADEPAEFVGYWIAKTGSRTFPAGVQRGLADAVQRLYNEYAALKYNSSRHAIRMADVIELSHPKPKAPWQGHLFKYLLDSRHHGDAVAGEELSVLFSRQVLQDIPEENRRAFVQNERGQTMLKSAGATWEYLSGWLPGGMDAEAWEAAIPNMGYMALLRNLRNFDEKGISEEMVDNIKATLKDSEAVAKSRQLPFRFWSAYNATKSTEWSNTLEKALDLSVQNIPEFNGTTLVLVDVSGSMSTMSYSARGTVRPCDAAALFGAALYGKNAKTTRVVLFGTEAAEVTPKQKGAVLRNMETFRTNPGIGHGTNIRAAAQAGYQGEDRIVVFTDLQSRDGGASGLAKFTHYFDLGGYGASVDPIGKDGTFMYGGFTDATFRTMVLNEAVRGSSWDDILG